MTGLRKFNILQGVGVSRDQKRYSLTSSVSKTFTAEGKSVVRTDYSELAPTVMADVLYAACENYVSQVALFMVTPLETHAFSPYRAL